jgi:mannosylglucosylglycerate synthase
MTEPGKPRIAILHYTAPPVVGGVEAVMVEHARLFAEAGYPTTLVVGRGGDEEALPPGTAVRRIEEIDSEFPQNMEIAAALDRGEVPPEFHQLRQQIVRALAEALQDVDVLIAHNVLTMHFNLPLTAALHDLLDEKRLPRLIAWTHDASWEDPLQKPHVRPGYPWDLLRRLRRGADYVVLTRDRQIALATMFHCPQNRLRIIPNGVHTRFWWNLSDEGEALIRQFGLLDGDIFILQPVRITQLKNIAYSLRVAAAVKALGMAPRFVVTGPPDPHDPAGLQLLENLRELRRELDLENEAVFICELSDNGSSPRVLPFSVVRDLYQACDIIFLPSTSEGFGIPVIEAGLIGRPVFCADIPPFREIGRDAVHRFSLNDDPAQIAGRLAAWALRDRAHKLRRRVWRNYTWHAVMRRHIEPLLTTMTP